MPLSQSKGKGDTCVGKDWAFPELALEIQTLDLRREPEPMAIISLVSALASHQSSSPKSQRTGIANVIATLRREA